MARPVAVIGLTLFFAMAVLVTLGVPAAALFAFGGICLAGGAAVCLIPQLRRGKWAPVLLLSAAAACLLLALTQQLRVRPAEAFAGRTVQAEVLLTDEGELRNGVRYVPANAVRINGARVHLPMRLTLPQGIEAQPYDTVRAEVTFYLPGGDDADRLTSFRSEGIFLAGYAKDANLAVLPRQSGHRLALAVIHLRMWLRSALFRMLPNTYGKIADAMILGEKHALPEDVYAQFRQSGLLHLLCVSGLHLSIWTLTLQRLLRRLRVPVRIAAAVLMAWTLLYMALTGFSYSVVRSGVMMLLFLLGEFLALEKDSLNSLGAALLVIALLQPYAVVNVGLLMSALSTLGLILEQRFAAPALHHLFSRRRFPAALRLPAEGVLTSAAVFVFTLPVSLYVYGGGNLAMFLSNLFTTVVAGPAILLTALGAVLFAAGWPYLNLPGLAGGFCIKYLHFVARRVASLSALSFQLPQDYACLLFAGVFLFVTAALLAGSGRRLRRLSAALAAAVLVLGIVGGVVTGRTETRLRVVDVGNGTAALLTCHGRNYLIGAGGTTLFGASAIRSAVQREGGRLRLLLLPDATEANAAYASALVPSCLPATVAARDPAQVRQLLSLPCVPFSAPLTDGDVTLTPLMAGTSNAVLAETPDLTALICFDPASALPAAAAQAQILVFRGDYPVALPESAVQFAIINAENLRGVLLQTELNARGVPAAATAACGTLLIRARSGSISVCRE